MNSFRNVVLQRECKELLLNAINVERGVVGGCSIEIEIKEPLSYDSFLYQGKNAEIDREHDFKILEQLLNERTTC
jgi:hypothetical protein